MTDDFYAELSALFKRLCTETGSDFAADRRHFHLKIKDNSYIFVLHEPGISCLATQTEIQLEDAKQIHIWEDQWRFDKKKIISKIKSIFGVTKRIHGRETRLISLTNSELIQFLEENHLNVPIKGKYKYGLQQHGDLVAIMSFSKLRMMHRNGEKSRSYELLRFCNKLDTTVVGGFSRLLSHFISRVKPDDVMTYIDADWSDGRYLISLGFTCIDRKPPMELWINTRTCKREYPHRIIQSLKNSDNPAMTEIEKAKLLLKNGYIKIYNSGSYKYIKFLKKDHHFPTNSG